MCPMGWWQRAGECSCSVKLGHPTGFDLGRKGAEGHVTVCCSRYLAVYVILRAEKWCTLRSNERASLSAAATASHPLSFPSLPSPWKTEVGAHHSCSCPCRCMNFGCIYSVCAVLIMITCVPFMSIIFADSKDEQNDRIYWYTEKKCP